jgi:hypothetical protein
MTKINIKLAPINLTNSRHIILLRKIPEMVEETYLLFDFVPVNAQVIYGQVCNLKMWLQQFCERLQKAYSVTQQQKLL